MSEVFNITTLLDDPRARAADEDIKFKKYKAAQESIWHVDPYNPNQGKIIDVFEPEEGKFLIQNKHIEEQPDSYFSNIKKKIDSHYYKRFNVLEVNAGILVTWATPKLFED